MANYPTLSNAMEFTEDPLDYQVIATKMEAGYVQTRAKNTTAPRVLHINHVYLSTADVSTWESFWNARKGAGESFSFTHPRTGSTITMRFQAGTMPSIEYIPNTFRRYNITGIVLEEAL